MQIYIDSARSRYLKIAVIAAVAIILGYLFRAPLKQIAILVLGASVLSFLAAPLADFYERKLSRPLAATACLATIAAALIAFLWLFLPAMIREIIALAQALPQSIDQLSGILNRASAWIEAHLPGIALPDLPLSGASNALSGIASGTIAFATNIADIGTRVSLMTVLSYFFLRDRSNLMLRLELLIPQPARRTAVRMGKAVCRELRLYLRGQALIALAVGALSSVGLVLIGVRSALILGPVIGILNMIPYFGPFIGGIPAVLLALGDSWQKAALTVVVLTIVQQLDGAFISPRIMGNLTGLSPALVLVAIFAGAQINGIVGMLFALPVLMAIRTLFRVFVQRHENI